MSGRIVIALPYYTDDRAATFRLARYICALEKAYRDDTELCFVARSDAIPIMPHEMMAYIPSFKISWHICEPGPIGHPAGANHMMRDFFVEAIKRANNGEWADVKAILVCEADCVPCAKDWLDQLHHEWDMQADRNTLVIGCYRSENVDRPHINGNALWHPRLADYADLHDKPGLGRDSAVFSSLDGRWVGTPLIANLWMETNVPEERMRKNPFWPDDTPPVMIHGVKTDCARKWAEKMTGVPFPK